MNSKFNIGDWVFVVKFLKDVSYLIIDKYKKNDAIVYIIQDGDTRWKFQEKELELDIEKNRDNKLGQIGI